MTFLTLLAQPVNPTDRPVNREGQPLSKPKRSVKYDIYLFGQGDHTAIKINTRYSLVVF
mgnify:CR=1 FL=1